MNQLIQSGQIYFVVCWGSIHFFQEHYHVDWGIDNFSVNSEVVIIEDNGFGKAVFFTVHYI